MLLAVYFSPPFTKLNLFGIGADDGEKADAVFPERQGLHGGVEQAETGCMYFLKKRIYIFNIQGNMVDGPGFLHGVSVFVGFDYEVAGLQESDRLVCFLIHSAVGCGKTQRMIKSNGLFQIVGWNADVLDSV